MAKVRVQDIAKELGISSSTVSRALNNHPKISDKTKKQIIEKAHQMGYFVNETKSFSAFPYRTTAVLYPLAAGDVIQNSVELMKIAEKQGYAVALFPVVSSSYVGMLTKLLLEKQFHSVISFFPESNEIRLLEELNDNGVKVIVVNPNDSKTNLLQLQIDIYKAAYEAFSHLVLMAGTNIAMVGTPELPALNDKIKKAYIDVLSRNGVEYNPECIYDQRGDLQDLHRWVFSLLDYRKDITGLFTASHTHMLQVVSSLRELGKKIPRDTKVISLSYSNFPEFMSPKITSMNFNIVDIITECFNLLKNFSTTTTISDTKILNAEFILRKSTL
ncbi:MAG: LacI family DNA-binding transcriptional regulator [Prolixibacteraceae bacterium]